MEISIVEVDILEKDKLANLLQLYLYDFSEFEDFTLNSSCSYEYEYFDSYWTDTSRNPFFIKADRKVVGFCLLNEVSELGNDNLKSIAEFFVLRKYRKNKVGFQAALEIFSQYKGNWEITYTFKNAVAGKFWNKVVDSLNTSNLEVQNLNKKEKSVISFNTN
jgi:predicted acetyltransferase